MKQYERYSVWSKHSITGERHWISSVDNLRKAILKVYQCYEDDRMHGSVGEYYYYIQDEPYEDLYCCFCGYEPNIAYGSNISAKIGLDYCPICGTELKAGDNDE